MKKQFILSGLLFVAIMLVGSNVWAQWNTTGNTVWTSNHVEIKENFSFMQEGFQVIMIHKGTHASEYRNVYAGAHAGSNSDNQTAVGFGAGTQNTGIRQTALGSLAGYKNSGGDQTVFGREAGRENTGAVQLALGAFSGFLNTGNYQVALGVSSGRNNVGSGQTAVGYQSGRDNSGHFQVAIGMSSGRENSGNNGVFIGHEAGMGNTEDNQFIVRHSQANATPLMRGNFATGELHINGPLYANGKITTKEVEVTLDGWPDFVFESSYNLRSIDELELFILENGHLPDVPNENYVLESGVNLGQMTATLLQKIEELTLYIIELNKKNMELQQLITDRNK